MPSHKLKKCPKGKVRSSITHRCVTRSTLAKQLKMYKKKSPKKSYKKKPKKSYKPKKSPKKSYKHKKSSYKHKKNMFPAIPYHKKIPGFSPGFISRMSAHYHTRALN
jgi:hypothetical protein